MIEIIKKYFEKDRKNRLLMDDIFKVFFQYWKSSIN